MFKGLKLLPLVALSCVIACGDDSGERAAPMTEADTGVTETTDTGSAADTGGSDTAAEADTMVEADAAVEADTEVEADTTEPDATTLPPCEGDLVTELPEDLVWLTVDGESDELFSFTDLLFGEMVEGQYGTYNFNTLEVYGANGFVNETPMTVYAAQARWTNLPTDGKREATLWAWPDFGSNGFSFDIDNPYSSHTRCLTAEDEGEWVTHTFAEPIVLDQPRHVFVGYYRPEVINGEFLHAELMLENFYKEENPVHAGARFPDYDEELFFKGLTTPWYTWQVRLGVVKRDPMPEKQFSRDLTTDFSRRVAWGDFDNDGDEDLMTNGPRLYENDGAGNFTDITADAIPDGTTSSTGGGVWGDYDNDGCLDYFGQGGGFQAGEVLLHNNCDGTLTDVIASSGISDLQETRDCDGDGEPEHSPTEGAGWVDLDGDGFLDLYLANYECSSEFDNYRNYGDRFFRNNGDGTFTDATEEVGVDSANHAGRGVAIADFDRDGDTDIYVSNYRLDPNFHYINEGDGTMVERSNVLGTQGEPVMRAYGHTIGSVFGDIDNDGDFDLINANLAHPRFDHFSDKSQVLLQKRDGTFIAQRDGLVFRETHSNPVLFDADNDGDLDLFITAVYATRDSDFYSNNGFGRFTLQNYESGLVVQNGWGAAAADADNDGDLDIAAQGLFVNNGTDQAQSWIQVRAVGTGDVNTSAIGATIEVEAMTSEGSLVQLRSVSGGSGTSSQDSLIQHVGVGDATQVTRVTVQFPYGPEVTITDLETNQRVWIYSDGTWEAGLASTRL